jgi:hypothetical protein
LIVKQVITLKNEPYVLIPERSAFLAVELVDRNVVEVILTAPRLIVHAEDVKQASTSPLPMGP